MNVEKKDKIKGGLVKTGYVCSCAFSRNKSAADFTCLLDSELKNLMKIMKEKSTDPL